MICLPPEICYQRLLSAFDVKYFDCSVGGTRCQTGSIVVHLSVMLNSRKGKDVLSKMIS